ncbi:LOW QUALITY PROTEIN: hypothetical protein PHMEG_00028937 [Phytophthora megakarya]|uniref:Uncharacterized protein n=1 Tax=Phytophthora megakarya TaxID=4795 RepID=A0A225V3U2_9STRA|nr:LOW QUALITY PROTEIN: hypothetical protein PHMEG_00028937 [Phytophthora megakarya]
MQNLKQDAPEFTAKSWLYHHCLSSALQWAAEYGHLEVWIYNNRVDECRLDRNPMNDAVANGHLAIAQFFHHVDGGFWSTGAMDQTAENGHLEILQWLHSTDLLECTKAAMDGAAKNGHLEVVKWLHESRSEGCSPEAFSCAVCNGHLEVVEWLYENVDAHLCTVNFRMKNVITAKGRLELLQWLNNHFAGSDFRNAMNAAASVGDLDVLKWLRENQYDSCTYKATLASVRNGHLDVLKWLHTHYPYIFLGLWLMEVASKAGHLEIVQWLHENNIGPFSTRAMDYAAKHNHLDIVLYLLENRSEGFSSSLMTIPGEIEVQCLFDSDANCNVTHVHRAQVELLKSIFESRPSFVQGCLRCLAKIAFEEGLIEILDWVKQFGLELRSKAPIRAAASRGDVKLLQRFYENGFEVCELELLDLVITRNDLDTGHWFLRHGYSNPPIDLAELAPLKKDVPLLRWMVEHGPPLSLPVATKLIVEFRHVELSWWVSESDRVQIVLVALQQEDRELVWWILTHTKFECENSRRIIRDGVEHIPHEMHVWFQESFSDLMVSSW